MDFTTVFPYAEVFASGRTPGRKVIQRTEEAKKMIEKIKFPPNWRDME